MLNLLSKRLALVAVGLLAALVWCAVVLLLGDIEILGTVGGFSFGFVLVSFAAAVICSFPFTRPGNDSILSGIPVQIFYSVVYACIAVVVNAVYIFAAPLAVKAEAYGLVNSLGRLIIVIDIIIFAAYLALMIFWAVHQEGIDLKVQDVEKKTSFHTSVSESLGVMMASVEDKEIRDALFQVKKKVDFGSNLSGSGDWMKEIQDKISQIRIELDGYGKKEDIMREIKELDALWGSKNASG